MTSINSTRNNSVALSLLQQAQISPLSGNGQNALSSKIANIRTLAATAQKAKDAIQAAKISHQAETEGTFLSAWKSAMASVGAAEIGAGGSSIARTVDNAEAIVGVLARSVNDYNGKFELQEIETSEEWAAFKDEWLGSGLIV